MLAPRLCPQKRDYRATGALLHAANADGAVVDLLRCLGLVAGTKKVKE